MTTPSARLTAANRRSEEQVRTVRPTEKGRAACAEPEARELFDHVENGLGQASYRDQRQAAATCDGCPLRDECGFRVARPAHSGGGQ